MTPCLLGAHKWAVVSSGKGQARSPYASTLTLNYSLQSREGLTAVVSLLDFLNSSWNWVCVWGGILISTSAQRAPASRDGQQGPLPK